MTKIVRVHDTRTKTDGSSKHRSVETPLESNLTEMATIPSPRDAFLDCLKGFAILTVVLGHTFQGTPDFDHYLPFRLVYSFHMPMFLFVAGMTASLGLSRRLKAGRPDFSSYASELQARALRLLVPFVTWAIIQYYLLRPQAYGPATWLLHIFQVPDNGLWFLLTVFQCCCVLVLVSVTVQYVLTGLAARRPGATNDSAIVYFTLIVVGIAANLLLRSVPLSQTFLPKGYFTFFFAGVVFHMIGPGGLPNRIRWIPYVIFLALAPFWYRTEMSPVASLFWKPNLANSVFRDVVAFAGTLAFVDLVRLFVDRAAHSVTRAVAYVGQRSLDLYAIHFYFLGYFPPVIAPIAASLGVSLLLRSNFVTSWLCLGQKPLNLWRMAQQRLSVDATVRSETASKAMTTSRG